MSIKSRLAIISEEQGLGMTLLHEDAYLFTHDLHAQVYREGYVFCEEDNGGGTVYVRLSDGAFMAGWPQDDGTINFSLWDSFFNEAHTLAEFEETFDRLWTEYNNQ